MSCSDGKRKDEAVKEHSISEWEFGDSFSWTRNLYTVYMKHKLSDTMNKDLCRNLHVKSL